MKGWGSHLMDVFGREIRKFQPPTPMLRGRLQKCEKEWNFSKVPQNQLRGDLTDSWPIREGLDMTPKSTGEKEDGGASKGQSLDNKLGEEKSLKRTFEGMDEGVFRMVTQMNRPGGKKKKDGQEHGLTKKKKRDRRRDKKSINQF